MNELWSRTLEHGLLALPLSLWLHASRRWAPAVLVVMNGLQTVPSMALFGLLITLPLVGGLGFRPALVALTLSALLPLIRGLLSGLEQLPRGLAQAGLALSLNCWQVLRFIEFPLALPSFLSGLRAATVIRVGGLATIAAAVGTGDLGSFIFRDIATVNNRLILSGALPTAALGLLADALLGSLQRGWKVYLGVEVPGTCAQPHRSGGRKTWIGGRLAWLLVAGLALTALTAAPVWRPDTGPRITLASKPFTEQLMLLKALAQRLEVGIRTARDQQARSRQHRSAASGGSRRPGRWLCRVFWHRLDIGAGRGSADCSRPR